jgi:hypothetical protein
VRAEMHVAARKEVRAVPAQLAPLVARRRFPRDCSVAEPIAIPGCRRQQKHSCALAYIGAGLYGQLIPDALYFPYSRCLDELTLKQAVLICDPWLFVDPVDSEVRSALYLKEAPNTHADPGISERWRALAC